MFTETENGPGNFKTRVHGSSPHLLFSTLIWDIPKGYTGTVAQM
jgi:hypothetical protein